MKSTVAILLTSLFLVTSTQAQISESTDDWPAWKKISAGSLSALSLLVTLASIEGAEDGDSNSSETDSGTDSGDSDTSNDSGSDSDSGDSNSDSGDNNQKAQGYVEELKDDLLSFMAYAAEHAVEYNTEEFQRTLLANEYPVLNDYYGELERYHPEVIAAVNERLDGGTQIDRLNRLMVVHLFE